ncbi:hypothetical protein TSAR_000676 [Trichomalopsis sarcophagae]|uniref:Uncharacterized protein n=1 Tax=Trichomalopsis sarcophagae TaxID=543379 RepID=A0A232EYA1_9HYME|nr:hypothetical protein TSAR_000676 [Trichomalopsis sarcophagae]
MKAVAFILVVCLVQGLQADNLYFSVQLNEPKKPSLNDQMKECLTQNDLDAGLYTELWKDHPKLNAPRKKVNCFLACLYKKVGALSADGAIVLPEGFIEERIINWSPELREKCKKQAGDDVCELAGCLDEPNGFLSATV